MLHLEKGMNKIVEQVFKQIYPHKGQKVSISFSSNVKRNSEYSKSNNSSPFNHFNSSSQLMVGKSDIRHSPLVLHNSQIDKITQNYKTPGPNLRINSTRQQMESNHPDFPSLSIRPIFSILTNCL